MKGMIGKKIGMTQVFDDNGNIVPVTIIQAGPCHVTQIRSKDKEGYVAVQLGFAETKPTRLTKGQLGHLKRNNLPALRHLREFRIKDGDADVAEGQEITVAVFEKGERVDIVGTSKGRGFAGTIKRHGFNRQPKTHGQSDRERAPGSVGQRSFPGRTLPGQRMAGRMGNERVTIQNLEVVLIDADKNLIAVRGSVPGAKNGIVMIKPSVKARTK
ncbi:MAG: 50S ribosomal protein L3 [Chloroflexi bacterium]|jgi:large subunit ribosomal protein L3|nr:MAG: 50S ribosomal protein L3 [Chloroflexi bacterium OLB13]MBC6956320.1 50S ribosomal protein L3 [Chloroflexota bacterium]MBV6434877.1 50S ribosomal protein L3 [Anaerolineae bacterium]MDL1916315.1 50S ribosomal protein L3 [Anaerolineae bacterium CFX4]OQY83866.1 MAG: 50S ribosomal protein L3 [Anaerolineae bacterium UTCFX5]